MCRDDDRVGGKSPQCIFESLQRITVADLAAHAEPLRPESCKRRVEPPSGGLPGAVLVRRPGPEVGVERRADDEDVLGHSVGHADDLVAEARSFERLVGDHDDPSRVLHRRTVDVRSRRRHLLPAAQRSDGHDRENHEDDEPEPRRDPGSSDDQRKVGDRAEDEPKRRLLVLERVAHRLPLSSSDHDVQIAPRSASDAGRNGDAIQRR